MNSIRLRCFKGSDTLRPNLILGDFPFWNGITVFPSSTGWSCDFIQYGIFSTVSNPSVNLLPSGQLSSMRMNSAPEPNV